MKVHNLLVTGSHTSSGEDIRLISSSVATINNAQNARLNSIESITGSLVSKTGSFATTGSNIFIGTQTVSGSIIPAVDNAYDLGSVTHQFRDLYLSSASLYIDGTKVLSSTTQELQITTDAGQSFKILEAGSDTITLQSNDGNITLATSGGGDVIMDPTNGIIALKGTTTIYAGNRILSSDGNNIHFGNGVIISGSLLATGTNLISGSSQILNGSGIISSSAQLPSGIISGSSQLPIGLISGSSQITSQGYATTGSNNFIGTQTITGSLFISQNLVVQGSSSLENITASAVNIGSNIVNLNTANPAIRFAGLNIFDSGSIGGSGSFLYDAVQDELIFVHRGDNSNITSSVLLMGPQTYNNVGNEIYPTNNRILKGAGNEHVGDSNITDTGAKVSINSNTEITGSLITTNKVGVGTNNPISLLQLVGSNTSDQGLFVTTTGTGNDFFAIKVGTGTSTDIFSVTNAGRVGIGVIPNTWSSGFTTLQVKNATFWSTGNDASITANAYYDGANYRYIGTSGASRTYHDTDGAIIWSQASSGSSGSTINFRQSMTLDASGNLFLGKTTQSGNAALTVRSTAGGNTGIILIEGDTTNDGWGLYATTADEFRITRFTNGSYSDKLIMTSTGNVTLTNSLTIQSGNSLFVNNANNTRSGFLKTSGEGTELSSFSGAGEPLILIAPDTTASMRFYTGGSTVTNERIRIISDGKVGIGTSTPIDRLNVSGGITLTSTLSDPTNTQVGSLQIGYNGTNGVIKTWSSSPLIVSTFNYQSFETDGTDRMRILSNGNIGVSNINPGYRFSIQGASNSGMFIKQGSQIGDTPASNNFYSALTFENTSTTNAWSIGYSQGAKFSINYFDAGSTYNRILTVTPSGQVAIGTVFPNARLHVRESVLFTNSGTDSFQSYVPEQSILTVTTDGNGTASSSFATNAVFKVGIGGGDTGNVTREWFRVNLNGNIGIGRNSPGNFNGLTFSSPITDIGGSLNIRGISSDTVAIINMGGTTFRKASIATSIGDNDPFLEFAVGSSGTSSSGTSRMRIDSSGRVTTPFQPSWCLRPNLNGNDTAGNSIVGWSDNTSGSSSKAVFLNGVTLSGSSSGILGATSTGRLTVPVAGKYKIWVTIRGENNPATGNIYIDVNGVRVARQHVEVWGATNGYPYAHGFLSLTLNLAANDYIEVVVVCSGLIVSGFNDTVNWFSGHLIG